MQNKFNINQLLQEAVILQQEGKFDKAGYLYREILKTQPKHPDANHNLGVIINNKKNSTEALKLFKIAVEKNPYSEQFWISYTNLLIKENKLEEAKFNIKKAIVINSSVAKFHYNLGFIFFEMNKFEEAEISYRKAIKLKPNYIDAYNNLSITLFKLGRFENAEIILKKMIEFNPDNFMTHYNLGALLHKFDKLEKAEISFKKSIELKPDHADAYYNLGVIYNQLGKLIESEKFLKIALNYNSTDKKVINEYGELLLKKNQHQKGLKFIHKGSGVIEFTQLNFKIF